MNAISKMARQMAKQAGYGLVKCDRRHGYPVDFSDEEVEMIDRVKKFTMTTPERLWSLIQATRHIVGGGIEGGIVECGVWRGGSMMAAALELLRLGERNRELYLCDTFEGMVAPGEHDVSRKGNRAVDKFEKKKTEGDRSDWHVAGRREVARNMALTGYPEEKIHYVEGKVEETLPGAAPEKIALLRLDTDWYESTRHELDVLYPLLSVGGVLIIDDYGDWQGAQKAVDEYFAKRKGRILLTRVDHSARMGVKVMRT